MVEREQPALQRRSLYMEWLAALGPVACCKPRPALRGFWHGKSSENANLLPTLTTRMVVQVPSMHCWPSSHTVPLRTTHRPQPLLIHVDTVHSLQHARHARARELWARVHGS